MSWLPQLLCSCPYWLATVTTSSYSSHFHRKTLVFKVKVTLRLTVSQSVSLGVKPHLGLMTRYLLLFDSYGLVFVERSLWQEDRFFFCRYCWPLPGAVFLRYNFLSPIWDFPFCHLLRLAGSRYCICSCSFLYILGTDHTENTASNSSSIVASCLLRPLPSSGSCIAAYFTVVA
jgi:hypothetical protein